MESMDSRFRVIKFKIYIFNNRAKYKYMINTLYIYEGIKMEGKGKGSGNDLQRTGVARPKQI